MLNLKDMVVKGYFSQPKIFKIIFSFLGQKLLSKIYIMPWRIFFQNRLPFKSTVEGIVPVIRTAINVMFLECIFSCYMLKIFLEDITQTWLLALIFISWKIQMRNVSWNDKLVFYTWLDMNLIIVTRHLQYTSSMFIRVPPKNVS